MDDALLPATLRRAGRLWRLRRLGCACLAAATKMAHLAWLPICSVGPRRRSRGYFPALGG